jgi:hypothetical protein
MQVVGWEGYSVLITDRGGFVCGVNRNDSLSECGISHSHAPFHLRLGFAEILILAWQERPVGATDLKINIAPSRRLVRAHGTLLRQTERWQCLIGFDLRDMPQFSGQSLAQVVYFEHGNVLAEPNFRRLAALID